MGEREGSDSKESACSATDLGLVSGWERSPGEGHVHPLRYSCLESPMDRGAWWASAHGAADGRTRPSRHARTCTGLCACVNISCERPDKKYFKHLGHTISVTTIHLCWCDVNAGIDNRNHWAWLCSSKTLVFFHKNKRQIGFGHGFGQVQLWCKKRGADK